MNDKTKLPDEVAKLVNWLNGFRHRGCRIAANHIERLARENQELETRLAMYDGGVTKETFERIDELEEMAASFEGSFNAAVKDIQRLDAALDWVIKEWVDPDDIKDMLSDAKSDIFEVLKARVGENTDPEFMEKL